MSQITALIADDEPLLREHLRSQLTRLWPALHILDDARNGREAVEMFDIHHPNIVFLDVQMPGLNGIEAARSIARRAHIVFCTAYEQYAVQAFEQGAVDYLVKPVIEARLGDTISRLQQKLAQPVNISTSYDALLDRMANDMRHRNPQHNFLQWIKASVGNSVRLIPVQQVAFLRADEKYTLVVWDGGDTLIRKSIRELSDALDPDHFVQTHRSIIVNLHYVSEVKRGINETAELHIRGRPDVLPVSRSYLHLFRQM